MSAFPARILSVALGGLMLAGCATQRVAFPPPPADAARTPLAAATATTIARDYAVERTGRPAPRLGLALSGGGTRAGMFAHGVLHGLNDTGLLDRVDVVSSVSGGGYAAYWYFARRMEMEGQADYRAIFADCRPDWWVHHSSAKQDDADRTHHWPLMQQGGHGRHGFPAMAPCPGRTGAQWSGPDDRYRWQAHLGRYTDLFRDDPVTFNGTNGKGPVGAAYRIVALSLAEIALWPLVSDSLFGQNYEYGISRTWGLTPQPRPRAGAPFSYDNAAPAGPLRVAHGRHTWSHLREAYARSLATPSPLPLWIVNTTVLPKQQGPNDEAIFEITPLSFGSLASGFRQTADTPDIVPEIPRSVRASAAAMDAQNVAPSQWRTLDTAGRIVPALRWGVPIRRHPFGSDPARFRLSDGGGSDNLGLISLVRRGIPDIILVDAEADIEGRFDGLCWDHALLADAGYDLHFETLQDFAALCDERARERSGQTVDQPRAYNLSAWRHPVVLGHVTPKAVRAPGPALPPIRVWLVKLAWREADYRRAWTAKQCETPEHAVSCLLTVFVGHQKLEKDYLLFPHLTTAGAAWNASQPLFWAYRELGRSAIRTLAWDGERLAFDPRRQPPMPTMQPLVPALAGRQPAAE